VDYLSVGCNRTPQAADWYDDHTLAYGAANSVALAQVSEVSDYRGWRFLTRNLQDGLKAVRVFATLHGHTDQVNCVTWIRFRGRTVPPKGDVS